MAIVETKLKVIHIQWAGPFSKAAAAKFSKSRDKGLYQIYGSHPVYGLKTLLYIGKTLDSFGKRKDGHEKSMLQEEHGQGAVVTYFGRLYGATSLDKHELAAEASIAESLLIKAHKPSWNAAGIKWLANESEEAIGDCVVLNWGDFGTLLPEVSSRRWLQKYKDDAGDDPWA